jgi:hypothetical protein
MTLRDSTYRIVVHSPGELASQETRLRIVEPYDR